MWEAFNFADINLMQILSTKAALVIVLAMSTYKILFFFSICCFPTTPLPFNFMNFQHSWNVIHVPKRIQKATSYLLIYAKYIQWREIFYVNEPRLNVCNSMLKSRFALLSSLEIIFLDGMLQVIQGGV